MLRHCENIEVGNGLNINHRLRLDAIANISTQFYHLDREKYFEGKGFPDSFEARRRFKWRINF